MIIDASVALKWLVVEEGSEAARALLQRSDLMVPTLLHSEVANALRKKQRQGELAAAVDLTGVMDELARIVQTVDEVSAMGRALEFAAALNHPAYDCVYLALAEQLGQQLVTADAKFLQKVEQSATKQMIVAL